MSDPLIASGEQVVITAGDLRLTVVTAGGGMRELTIGDWQVLDGYAPDEVPVGAYGQPLIPWPNRLADGRYEFEGRTYQVPLSEPEKHNALHGFARWMTWRIEQHEASRARLGLEMYPRTGYPFALRIAVVYEVTPSGVTITTSAVNAGRSSLPYANGFHPYISAGTASIDECRLQIPADSWIATDERQIPVERRPVEQTIYDFRSPRPIGSARLDTAYTDLTRDSDGRSRLRLESEAGRQVTVWMGEGYRYVMAFTGDTLTDTKRRRRGLGVEPMTAAPNAFRSGEGLRILAPGESFLSDWGIEAG
jgi:aldose 1-epimerase